MAEQKEVTWVEMKKILQTVMPEEKIGQKRKPGPLGAHGTGFVNPFHVSLNKCDEVFPGIMLGGEAIARDIGALRKLGITHVLNAAQGQKFAQIDTTEAYYKHETWNIQFMGVQAMDVSKFDLSDHFYPAAEYIHNALESQGKVYVHCFQGVSRSASLVLAYLMLYRKIPLPEGLTTLRHVRSIFPNDGFLRQLCQLHNKLFVEDSLTEKSLTEGTVEKSLTESTAEEADNRTEGKTESS